MINIDVKLVESSDEGNINIPLVTIEYDDIDYSSNPNDMVGLLNFCNLIVYFCCFISPSITLL